MKNRTKTTFSETNKPAQNTTNKEDSADMLSYDKIQTQFRQEAHSLISEHMIDQTLATEKQIFQNAEILQIKTKKIVFGNPLRHCKNMLRKNQPFYMFYLILDFITELSMFLLLFNASFYAVRFFTAGNNPEIFSRPFPFLCGLILLGTILLYTSINTAMLRNLLQKTNMNGQADAPKIETIKKKRNRYRTLLILVLGAICSLSIYVFIRTELATQIQATLFDIFLVYVLCIFLSGVHNTLYSSHFIPFLSIGGFILSKRSNEKIEQITEQYMNLSFLQLAGNRNKTQEDLKHNPRLALEIKIALRSRLVTQRIYYAFAIFILVLLAGVCIYQLSLAFSVTLLLFGMLILFITAELIAAFLSANYVIKKLPKINV